MIQKNSEDTYLNLDWLEKYRENDLQLKPHLSQSLEVKNFFSHFWPNTSDYQSPFENIFLIQAATAKIFNSRPKWFIRDGLIPLLWFFKTHPTPAKMKSRIYIHQWFQH